MKIDIAEGIGIMFLGSSSPSPALIKRLLDALNDSPEVEMASYSVVFKDTGPDRRILVYPETAKTKRRCAK